MIRLLLKYCIYCASVPSLHRESTDSLTCTQLTNTKHSWQNGTRCRDGVKLLWCHSHLVWLVFEGCMRLFSFRKLFCDLYNNTNSVVINSCPWQCYLCCALNMNSNKLFHHYRQTFANSNNLVPMATKIVKIF